MFLYLRLVFYRFVTFLVFAGLITLTTPIHAQDGDSSASPTVLITGSNRGIGYEFARQYAERGWRVIATSRKPAQATSLKELQIDYPNVVMEQLDVTDHDSIDALAAKYEGQPIDILVNNAGISGGGENQIFGKLNYDVFQGVMDVNVMGPLKMAEAFLANVEASEHKKIMTVSSSQGSITQVKVPMLYFYRASKTALNMTMRNLAIQLKGKGVIVGMVAPGATKTDFMKGLKIPLGDPKDRVGGMITVIDDFTLENTGAFIEWTGEELPW